MRSVVLLRRYLSLGALLFWQGGFTFYAAVVIPITRQVLSEHSRLPLAAQITGPVTTWLNWAGVVALLPLLWDLAVAVDASRRRFGLRCACWAVCFASLSTLFMLHYLLDRYGPLEGLQAPDQPAFWMLHSAYIWTSTLVWLGALIYLGLTLSAWRAEDGAVGTSKG